MPRMDFSQWIRVIESFEHFECHQSEWAEEGEDFTVLDFISIHFLNPEQHGDDHDHEDLPLQQFNQGMQLIWSDIYFDRSELVDQDGLSQVSMTPNLYHFDFLQRIERPPSC